MSPTLRIRPLWLLAAALLGCDGPSGPSLGSLRVTVLGLPNGTAAAVTVTGPGGFSQSAQATQTFSQLTPGTYTVTAANVPVGDGEYSANPATQTVAVPASGNTASASVFYSQATGNLSITITGLGTGSAAAVTVTGPGYTQEVPATTTLFGLDPGSYVITARDTVAEGGTTHSPTPTSQNVTVVARGTASASVAYTAPSSGSLNLRIAGLYINQSTQTYPATVPLVRDRDGYLRVFVVANRTTVAAEVPSVRVRYYNGGVLPVDSALILNTGATSVPTAVNESLLIYTWNVLVPGSLIQPGLSIQAEVDPANAVLEDNETDNLFPTIGSSAADVQTVPTLRVTFVPILQSTSGLQGNVTSANRDAYLDMTRRMHPVAAIDAVISSQPFSTTTTLQADGTGWVDVLFDFNGAMVADGRYYYGVVRVSYGSGVAGVAYVSQGTANAHAALGWDHDPPGSASIVAAHELAHNWGRNHAPCGGAGNPDPLYPQPDGTIGSYGLDVSTVKLKPDTLSDIMGYCDP
ncbi:MAG TPA: zinc-dependent metalloprotease family protein, partial [Gemmatimonadales bacterium]|nr:zinc-dependent metalloprotease family protein [Gemmatimonadales bacterium]